MLFHEILLKYVIIDLAGHIHAGLDRFVKNIRRNLTVLEKFRRVSLAVVFFNKMAVFRGFLRYHRRIQSLE